MTQLPHLFADRIINIAVTGPLIRLELGTVIPPTSEGAKPGLRSTQTIVMPLDGFLASFGMLESLVKKMIADGMVTPRPQTGLAATPDLPQTRQ